METMHTMVSKMQGLKAQAWVQTLQKCPAETGRVSPGMQLAL